MTMTPAPIRTSHLPDSSVVARFTAALIIMAVALGLILVPSPARASDDTDRMVELINQERRARGRSELTVHPDLTRGAQRQAQAIADAGELFHNQDLGSLTTGWKKLGENVAVAGTVEQAHQALMNSSAHKDNILEAGYSHVGVGVVRQSGSVWVAEVFMEQAAGASQPTSFEPPFSDDDDSVHQDSIRRLAQAGITSGCGGTRFCPDASVTRGQMAAFLVRALGLPPGGGDPFTDDNSSMFEDAIESLAKAGITSGCGGTRFCPDGKVTRGQMAAFLVRALNLPPGGGDPFTDDNSSMFEDAIESLARAGITQGCGNGKFCPDAAVTRAEMATFLVRAFRY